MKSLHALAAVALLAAAPAWAQRGRADAPRAPIADTPLGLSVLWRSIGRRVERGGTGATLNAFSPNGRLVAIYEGMRVRVFDAASGKERRGFTVDPSSAPPFSLAVSSGEKVALGRMGNAELLEPGKPSVRHWCEGACGTLTSIAFSPDDRFLAYQGIRGLPEWRSGLGGLISVVNLKTGAPLHLEAISGIAQVGFSNDGRTLYAMNTSRLDDRDAFGVRAWSAADWRVTQSVTGSKRTMRRVAPLGDGRYAGVAMNGGNIEARDLGDDRVLWSVPLVPPEQAQASGQSVETNLDLVEIAPNGKFVVSYEASLAYDATGAARGTLVIRGVADGAVEALYDVGRISDLTIAPDSKTFVFSTAVGQTYTAVAHVPF